MLGGIASDFLIFLPNFVDVETNRIVLGAVLDFPREVNNLVVVFVDFARQISRSIGFAASVKLQTPLVERLRVDGCVERNDRERPRAFR